MQIDLRKESAEKLKAVLMQQQATAWQAQRELQQAQQAEQAIYAELQRREEEKRAGEEKKNPPTPKKITKEKQGA